jgi:anti-sigma B factor antagonist
MEIIRDEICKVAVLHIKGRIDITTSQELKDEVMNIFESGETHLGLEFSEVDYMDTSGLGSLISVLKEARKKGVALTIINPSNFIKGLFQLTQMDKIFQITDSVDNL